jgi:hypothetical protein
MDQSHLAVLLVGAALGGLALYSFLGWLRRLRLRLRFSRAQRKEAEAATLLERRGYRVLSGQLEGFYELLQDGESFYPKLRADYLVERRGKVYIAEAKSGSRAPDVLERHTRRQLLEYAIAYEVDGVLLVDTEAKRISEISFPALRRGGRRGLDFALGILVGALAGALFASWG